MARNPWFLTRERTDAAGRVFCVPHAGGGASGYLGWANWLPPEIGLWAVQLPGRENRYREPALRAMDDLVPRLAEEMGPLLDRPYVLFGSSMGGHVVYELARHLAPPGRPPDHVFVAACRPPHAPPLDLPASDLDDSSFLRMLQDRFGGVPDEVSRDPSVASVFLPTLRTDLELLSNYQPSLGPPLACPLTALGGRDDRLVPPWVVAEWARYSRLPSALAVLPGGHFFAREHPELIVERILGALAVPIR